MFCHRDLCVLAAFLIALLPLAARAASDLARSKQAFLAEHGVDYGYDGRIDELWSKEVGPRLPADEHYLDFTGSSLYWNSQVEAAVKELQGAVFGNPHSANPSSLRTEALVEELRRDVLRMLGADPSQYDLVFTRSGTGALHNMGETFPWASGSRFAYLTSNHNSVLGIREYARRAGAAFGAVTEQEVEAWLGSSSSSSSSGTRGAGGSGDGGSAGGLPQILAEESAEGDGSTQPAAAQMLPAAAEAARNGGQRQLQAQQPHMGSQQPALSLTGELPVGTASAGHSASEEPAASLFAYPAYDNFAGVMYPLSWVRAVQAKSGPTRRWKVLLDAAAFLPTHPLNLTETPADFVCISFYKLFGYPTGLGAWVARRQDIAAARKVYWGGGSVFLATAAQDWRHLRPAGPERFEDGTLPFLNIIALRQGLQVFDTLHGQAAIERHTSALRAWLYEQLAALRHSNGAPLLRIFGRHHWPNSREVQGATFNFQILKPNGEVFSYRTAATALAEAGFHMRCGCTCNPGACYGFLGVRDEEVKAAAELAHGNFTDWEWVWVRREVDQEPSAGAIASPDIQHGPVGGPAGATGGARLVKLPLGSLRASLGYMSRFEDVHALVEFLRQHYTDRMTDAELDSASAWHTADGTPAGGELAGGAHGKKPRKEPLRWAAESFQSPGWC